jgi:hypothetical protein
VAGEVFKNLLLVGALDNKRTGTTIKVSDGIRSERAFDLQKGDEDEG